MTPDRAERIADYIRAELASVVLREMRDPRVSMLSVTDTQVSRDFAVADVYVASVAATDEAAQEDLVSVLNNAAGFLRSAVAKRHGWRKTPKLRFHYDDLPERGARIGALIDQAVRADQRNERARRTRDGA
ncbi:MAG: 30S ribosome-binding factor RbfA [Gammaproteobacteria bacterium]|nr:30S ribosome-binding factor RbfA [Gammaproteobacteria bacterium]